MFRTSWIDPRFLKREFGMGTEMVEMVEMMEMVEMVETMPTEFWTGTCRAAR